MKQSVIGKGLLVLVVVLLLATPGISSAKGRSPDIFFDEPGSSSPEHLAISSYRKAQVNLGLTDEDKVKNAVDTYFRLRYESQRLLEAQDCIGSAIQWRLLAPLVSSSFNLLSKSVLGSIICLV